MVTKRLQILPTRYENDWLLASIGELKNISIRMILLFTATQTENKLIKSG